MNKETEKFLAQATETEQKINKLRANLESAEVINIVMLKDVLDGWQYTISNLREWISYVDRDLYKHTSDGHFPKIPSATAMKKVIEINKLGEEYKVAEKVVYASDRRGNVTVEVGD